MKAYVIAGMAFGDEGKGSMVDYLCRRHDAKLVVRYNGGPQASHNVVLPDGGHHAFAQLGSGSFYGAKTHLSRFMLVEPFALENEVSALWGMGVDALSRLSVDPRCVVITPYHWMMNRAKEKSRGEARHGSCGFGIGEARGDELSGLALRFGDLADEQRTARTLTKIQRFKLEQASLWRVPAGQFADESPGKLAKQYREMAGNFVCASTGETLYREGGDVIFEGAQGVLLDETHGHKPPHVTWTNTTFENALTLLEGTRFDPIRIGVFRGYFTRHGAGPLPTEVESPVWHEEIHNKRHPYQGDFRFGWFDDELALHAIKVAPPDMLAITCADEAPAPGAGGFAVRLGVPVGYLSFGPTWKDKEELDVDSTGVVDRDTGSLVRGDGHRADGVGVGR